jgi:hypothetical protein
LPIICYSILKKLIQFVREIIGCFSLENPKKIDSMVMPWSGPMTEVRFGGLSNFLPKNFSLILRFFPHANDLGEAR